MTKTERNTLIVDAYNANPTSMAAAMDNFASVQAESKIAMLGDMLELGADSVAEHVTVVKKALSCGACRICLVGGEFFKALEEISEAEKENIVHFMTSDELATWVENAGISGSVVLIKGSRGTRMEKIVEKL